MSFVPATEVDLDRYSTLALSSRAECFARVDDHDSLMAALAWAGDRGLSVTVLGEGSNVVLRRRLPGLVVQPALPGIAVTEDDGRVVRLAVGSGENWHGLVTHCLAAGYHGLENLALIPGSVGAAPIQNIGAYGVEVAGFIERVETVSMSSGAARSFEAEDCRFAYRDSVFKHAAGAEAIITRVRLRLDRQAAPVSDYPGLQAELAGRTPDAQSLFAAVVALRRRKLPDWRSTPNAGSFFKNPVLPDQAARALCERWPKLPVYPQGGGQTKLSAAWLIEHCGWRGRALGPAAVSAQHALVLTNTGGATGADILTLAAAIQTDVAAAFDVALEIEPRVLGID